MSNGRMRLLLCAFFACLMNQVHGNNYTVLQTVFLPPIFYVGDIVEVRVRIDSGGTILPSVPKELPDQDWIEIREVQVIPIAGEYDIRIEFVSFAPGRLEIPAIAVGDLLVGPIAVETASIRDDEADEPIGILDPVYLPGTRLLIGIVAGVVLFGPLLLLLVIGWIRHAVARLAPHCGRPFRRFRRELESLRESAAILSSRDFYQQLFDAFRRYLTGRTGVNYRSLTTREMDRRMRKDFRDVDSIRQFSAMIEAIDRVKFGGGEVDDAEKFVELSIVRKAAGEIEERIARRSRE